MALVVKSRLAEEDLIEIWLFIANDNPMAADATIEAIEQKFEDLAERPRVGHDRKDLLLGLRSGPWGWTMGNYLIFYREMDAGVQIVRVLHGARDLEALFE